MPTPVRQNDMEAIFAVTDALGIHREAVTVALGRRDPGSVRQVGSMFEITIPETTDSAQWSQSTFRKALARLGYEELP